MSAAHFRVSAETACSLRVHCRFVTLTLTLSHLLISSDLALAFTCNSPARTAAHNIDDCPSASPAKLSRVDETISSEHEETLDTLFECSGPDREDGQYIDLKINPERFTGTWPV